MKLTTWLVQTNIAPESPTPALLQGACGRQGRLFLAITVLPGSKSLPEIPQAASDGPVVFHGRSTLILNARSSPWKHGVFFDPDTFGHRAYAKGYGDRLLNDGAVVMTWAELLRLTEKASGYRFIKPIDDFKGFTGQALSLSAVPSLFEKLHEKHGHGLLGTEVVVAQAQEVDAEWRLFVVDGKVVTGSMYRPAGGSHVPADVLAFAQSAIRDWTPAPVFALDVGKIGNRLKIIECNCFNASRLYDSDVDRLVQAVSDYQEARYATA